MISFTKFILLLFFAYLCNAIFVFYHLFTIEKCVSNCILPEYPITSYKNLKVSVYTSRSNNGRPSDMSLVWDSGDRLITQTFESDVNITLPFATRRNGSLYAYVFLHPADASPFHGVNNASAVQIHQLSEYAFPKDRAFNLIQGGHSAKPEQPITHVHSKMAVFIAEFEAPLNRYGIPAEIYTLLTINSNYKYLPILYVDQLSTLKRNLVPILSNTSEVKVQLSVKGVSIGRLRIWAALEQNMLKMKQFGFTDADLDDVKGIFTDTNMLLLTLTFVVALVHLLFDVLAFKNEVSFWKKKETMEGMSTRAVLWRCVSTTIIFMYLCTEKTSLLVLLPAGVGTIIEFWKVTKALKIRLDWSAGGKLPGIKFGEKSTSEKQTSEFDQQAMTYLSYALYPLLACGAVYSLLYQPHKSWWSWIIGSLVNGVYAFGFLFMLPQLFVNYKLKSVAHLPWRAFMYKAFNTFIDDVFAFIIVMPTAHRLACFRDDIIFIIYLYQRWLYPVDKSRANEYGMKFEEDKTIEETKKEK